MALVREEIQWQALQAFIEEQMNEWKVPGLAISIIQNGDVVFQEGFGYRHVEEQWPVTPDTLFAVGSVTKAMTTLLMSLAAEEGKLDWDAPVRQYLPAFKLQDAWASERITSRDLACHRSGLPRHDLSWYKSEGLTREELIERVPHLKPNKEFRTAFQYQNHMYAVAGYLAGNVLGTSWEEAIQHRIFNPLGMVDSKLSVEAAQVAGNAARPYEERKGEVQEIPYYNIDALAPAGGVYSNVRDMTRWLQLYLNKGQHEGKAFLSEGALNNMLKPHMIAEQPMPTKEIPYTSYGLGWFVAPYRGHKMFHHGGNIDGFTAYATMMPEENIGIVILTNKSNTMVPPMLAYRVYEQLLGLSETDWSARLKEVLPKMEAMMQPKISTPQVENTSPSHALSDYVGEYHDKGYGTLTVQEHADGLVLKYNAFELPLTHYHYDIFAATLPLMSLEIPLLVSFATDREGKIRSVGVPFEMMLGAEEIVFDRVPQREMVESDVLAACAGTYEVMGMTMIVEQKGEQGLSLTLPGQPTYELVPEQGMTFALKGLAGFRVEFKREGAGVMTEAVLMQPNGVFTAKRVEL